MRAPNTTDDDLRTFGWPPILTTARAVVYTGKSRRAICRAVKAGTLVPVGRSGRSYTFNRDSLDVWLSGRAVDAEPGARVIPLSTAVRPVPTRLEQLREGEGRGSR